MPSIQQRGDSFQLRVKHKRLAVPFFHTFDSREKAEAYGAKLVEKLDAGIVPTNIALHVKPRADNDTLLVEVVREYTKKGAITASDDALLTAMGDEIKSVRLSSLTVEWVEAWVLSLKIESNLAPGTIRKRVGALARVMDWHIRRTTPKGEARPANPLRGLPTGYSFYSKDEAAQLDENMVVKHDVQRDRRFEPGEEDLVRSVLMGFKPEGKFKRVKQEPAFVLFFDLILDTGLRLSEAFTLRVDQLELAKGYTRVDGSKGARGKIKPRTVPLKPHLIGKLQERVEQVKSGRLFPWWDGSQETKKAVSAYLSKRFSQLFAYCGLLDFTEHDLRHEATCRWVTMRSGNGWMFSEIEITKIMGWSSLAMMIRYASLRGEDLAERLRV